MVETRDRRVTTQVRIYVKEDLVESKILTTRQNETVTYSSPLPFAVNAERGPALFTGNSI